MFVSLPDWLVAAASGGAVLACGALGVGLALLRAPRGSDRTRPPSEAAGGDVDPPPRSADAAR